MEWTVVVVIIALVGLMAAVVKPIVRLNTTLVELTGCVKVIKDETASLSRENTKSHARIWSKLDEHTGQLRAVDQRLFVVEHCGPAQEENGRE